MDEDVSLFDPKFLDEISKMKEKNIAVEMLRKLLKDQVRIYRKTDLVRSEKFSERLQQTMNKYINGMLTNEEVIEELLLKLARQIGESEKADNDLGLTREELAFYHALTEPQAVRDFYENDQLVAITKELTEMLRKSLTIDWQKKESARAGKRIVVKKLLKKYKYPPDNEALPQSLHSASCGRTTQI